MLLDDRYQTQWLSEKLAQRKAAEQRRMMKNVLLFVCLIGLFVLYGVIGQ